MSVAPVDQRSRDSPPGDASRRFYRIAFAMSKHRSRTLVKLAREPCSRLCFLEGRSSDRRARSDVHHKRTLWHARSTRSSRHFPPGPSAHLLPYLRAPLISREHLALTLSKRHGTCWSDPDCSAALTGRVFQRMCNQDRPGADCLGTQGRFWFSEARIDGSLLSRVAYFKNLRVLSTLN